jgi:hypothetical protein
LKAKLRRLCEPKKGGRLQVPQWLHDEWKAGDHLALAKQYQTCGFDKALNTHAWLKEAPILVTSWAKQLLL